MDASKRKLQYRLRRIGQAVAPRSKKSHLIGTTVRRIQSLFEHTYIGKTHDLVISKGRLLMINRRTVQVQGEIAIDIQKTHEGRYIVYDIMLLEGAN